MSGQHAIHSLMVTVEVDEKGEVTKLLQVFAAGEKGFEEVSLGEAVADPSKTTSTASNVNYPLHNIATAETEAEAESGRVLKDVIAAETPTATKGFAVNDNMNSEKIHSSKVRFRKPNNEVQSAKVNDKKTNMAEGSASSASSASSAAPIPAAKGFQLNAEVEANYKNQGKWYRGIVIGKNMATGKYTIKWDGSEGQEKDVDPSNVRVPEKIGASAAKSTETPAATPTDTKSFAVNDKVKAKFKGRGRWYAGRVSAVNDYGRSYNIKYDDGNEELNVDKSLVRALDARTDSVDPIVGGGTRRRASTSSRYTSRRLLKDMRAKRRANFMF